MKNKIFIGIILFLFALSTLGSVIHSQALRNVSTVIMIIAGIIYLIVTSKDDKKNKR